MTEIKEKTQIVFTNKARCHDCYRCIRVCPVKAIKMKDGQAQIQKELCISCGTCIRECPQGAKTFRNDVEMVRELLGSGKKLAICIAPSFAALFEMWEYDRLSSALRKLGFSFISETAIGATYVADETAKLIGSKKKTTHIATACPAIVNLVEKYMPETLPALTPVVSPMIAAARRLKAKLGDDWGIVFVGPCIAKKSEADRPEYNGLVDAVLTFIELMELFELEGIKLANFEESGFNESSLPISRLYPLSGGLAKTAAIDSDVTSAEVISVTGIQEVMEAMHLKAADGKTLLIDPLFCSMGCINGPGVSCTTNLFERRQAIIEYSKSKHLLEKVPDKFKINVKTEFDKEALIPKKEYTEDEILSVLEKTGNTNEADRLNCQACGYENCREKAIAVLNGMAEPEMCMPYMRRKAEAKTGTIIESSPNGIVILDEHFKILSMNPAFRKFFMCSESVAGKPISYLMDPDPFYRLKNDSLDIIEGTITYEKYNLICHQITYFLKEEKQYVGIFVNITKNISDQTALDEIKQKTIRQAKELLDHQIDMAQNIAKLLGESTARGEELVENLMKLTQGENVKHITGDKQDWLWDTYTSR